MKIRLSFLIPASAWLVALGAFSLPLNADTGAAAANATASTQAPPPNPLSPIPNGKEIVDQFRDAYAKQKKPRLLLYVNRDLLPQQRLEITGRSEKTTQVKGDATESKTESNVQIGSNNSKGGSTGGIVIDPRQTGLGGEKKEITTTYSATTQTNTSGGAVLTDFDLRQLEESFRAPYFAAGARFVDQRIAASLIKSSAATGDRFLTAPTTDTDKEQLDALKKSADIVIELLARHYDVAYPTPAGDTTIHRLDLVATAFDVRQPGLVIGQISSESLFGFNQPGGTHRQVTDREIIDQTALALMQQLSAQ